MVASSVCCLHFLRSTTLLITALLLLNIATQHWEVAHKAGRRYTCSAATRRIAVFYGSYSTADDMAWGAMWLYNATRQQMWLDTVRCEPALIRWACLLVRALSNRLPKSKGALLLCFNHQKERQRAYSRKSWAQKYAMLADRPRTPSTRASTPPMTAHTPGTSPMVRLSPALRCLQLFISIAPATACIRHAGRMYTSEQCHIGL